MGENNFKKKRNLTSIEWNDNVFETIKEAKKNKSFNLGEAVNAAFRTYGRGLKQMASIQKQGAYRTLDYIEKRTKGAGKRS